MDSDRVSVAPNSAVIPSRGSSNGSSCSVGPALMGWTLQAKTTEGIKRNGRTTCEADESGHAVLLLHGEWTGHRKQRLHDRAGSSQARWDGLVHPEDEMDGLDERAHSVTHLEVKRPFAAGGGHHRQLGAARQGRAPLFSIHCTHGHRLDRVAQTVARRSLRRRAKRQNGSRRFHQRPGYLARSETEPMRAVLGDDASPEVISGTRLHEDVLIGTASNHDLMSCRFRYVHGAILKSSAPRKRSFGDAPRSALYLPQRRFALGLRARNKFR